MTTLPAPTPDQLDKAAQRQDEQAKAAHQFATVLEQLPPSRSLTGLLHSVRMSGTHHQHAARKLRALARQLRTS